MESSLPGRLAAQVAPSLLDVHAQCIYLTGPTAATYFIVDYAIDPDRWMMITSGAMSARAPAGLCTLLNHSKSGG